MGKHISSFATTASFEDMRPMLKSPHVALTKDNMQVHCKPRYIETKVTGKLFADANSEKTICGETSGISAIEIDGVTLQTVPETYTFSTEGEHTIVYTLADPTTIEEDTFFGTDLESITIPDSVTSISDAFRNNRLRKIIVLGNNPIYDSRNNCNAIIETATNELIVGCSGTVIVRGVTSIGDYAFYAVTVLDSITIPYSVTSIGDSAFQGCTDLTSVTIPSSVTSVGSDAFWGTAWYENQPDGLVYVGKVAYTHKGIMPQGTEIVLREGTSSITGDAFKYCSDLTSISIPNSVTSIGSHAFNGCTSLTSVTIPNSVTSIGDSAFYNCTSLTSVTIGNSVTSIGNNAFWGCTSLTKVITTDLRSWCNIDFSGYNSNPLFYAHDLYSDENTRISDIYNYESGNVSGITRIKNYSFVTCSLADVYLNVTSIGDYAFDGSTVSILSLDDSLTTIGRGAFSSCSNLVTIETYSFTPPTIHSDTFKDIKTGGSLRIPIGSSSAYNSTWMSSEDYYLGKYGWTISEELD